MKITIFVLSILLSCFSFAAKPGKAKKKENSGGVRPSREEMIKKFDTDGDGKLSAEERAEVRKEFMAKGKLPPFVVKEFDKDGDGKLNVEERSEARAKMADRKKEAIKEFDKDGDGKLNEEERKAALAPRKKPRKDKRYAKGKKGGKKKDKSKKKKDS